MAGQGLDDIRAGQVAALYRNAAPGTFGGLIAGPMLVALLVHSAAVPLRTAAAFLAVLVLHSSGRLALLRAYHKVRPPPAAWRRWALGASISALVGGLCWGVGALFLMDPIRAELQLIVLLVCAGLAAGAISAFGTFLPAYYCNLFGIMVPTTIWAVGRNDELHLTYAALATLWIAVIAILARSFSRILAESLRLQFDNRDLAADLRRQKDVAEDASRAKSRFLASASHDLRQPVHALGLFVGALRSREMDEEARRLVDRIEGSIAALDGLFTAILDISRLDAGAVEVHHRAFPIQPLLERVCRDEAAEAARKQIVLRLIPCRLNVESDPILLERILRNLVANAVRYTDAGRVVVGCRRGERLGIEVWDSGRGIPLDQHELIFQEFYQISNPERDRSRGLGLGLAIVRRLTQMLDIELTLRSAPDKGSVFRLAVRLAAAGASIPAQAIDLPSGTLNPRFVLVVDDETAVQEAMRALLTAWGHTVTTAGSGREMLERTVDCATPPDLIICDYRLRGDESGIDTIQRLRSEFNDDIPAIIMTGDTAPDRIREAMASGCFLMHKPVSNSKLRAAITNLTLRRGSLASVDIR
jgi:signal transduction histidine kinase/ActR/RegA family two-component response regulator